MTTTEENMTTAKNNQEIKTNFTYTPADFTLAYKLHFRYVSFWRKNFMRIVGIGSIALGFYFLMIQDKERGELFIYFLILYGVLLVMFNVYNQQNMGKKVFKSIGALHFPFVLRINDSEMHLENKESISTLAWEKYFLVLADEKVTLLYLAPNVFHILPSRIFSEKQLLQVHRLLMEKQILKKKD